MDDRAVGHGYWSVLWKRARFDVWPTWPRRCGRRPGLFVDALPDHIVDWQQLDTGQTNQLLHTAFAGGKFVVSGANGTLLTSVDGVNWMRQALDTTNTLGEVAWSGGIFAVREVGTAAVFTSSDSILWSR